MDINVYLFHSDSPYAAYYYVSPFCLTRVRTQLALIKDALEDIKGGNLNRRI